MNGKILKEMLAEFKKSSSIYSPSDFWQELNKTHIKQLSQGGFDSFKRTVNLRYFNWGILGILRHQLMPILSELRRKNFAPILDSHFVNPKSMVHFDKQPPNIISSIMYGSSLDAISAFIYKMYVASLRDYIWHEDKLKILDRLEEPLVGNPFVIKYKKKLISQDLLNSIHEFYSIYKKSKLQKDLRIAEIGAGYGRLAYVFLSMMPKASYCIIDIPPSLFISQEYLSKVFPKEKIFYFRPFTSFKNVKKEFEASRIRFLMAHQVEYLPDKYFDLITTVSSLHEMTLDQINNYIKHIDRLARGYFYTKQWRRSRVKDNFYIKENEYKIPKKWKAIFKRIHPIQRMFFEALYKVS